MQPKLLLYVCSGDLIRSECPMLQHASSTKRTGARIARGYVSRACAFSGLSAHSFKMAMNGMIPPKGNTARGWHFGNITAFVCVLQRYVSVANGYWHRHSVEGTSDVCIQQVDIGGVNEVFPG